MVIQLNNFIYLNNTNLGNKKKWEIVTTSLEGIVILTIILYVISTRFQGY